MKRTLLFFQLAVSGLFTTSASAQNLQSPYRITPRTGAQHVELSGIGWELSHADQPVSGPKAPRKDAFATTVPNSVHWAYFKAGKLPHPYARKNSEQYKWVDEKAWYYRKTFPTPAGTSGNRVFLCFDGVDYLTKVWLNDSLVGTHEGMFGGPNVEISRLLKPSGTNELLVEVRAGNWGNRAGDFESLPRTASGERDYSKRGGYNPRASGKIVKPWIISGGSGAEMFFSVGMWRGVRLEIVPPFHLERPFLTTKTLTNGGADLHLSTEIFTKSHSLQQQLHPWHNTQLRHPNERGYAFTTITEPVSVSVEFRLGEKTVFTKEFTPKLYAGRNWLEEDFTLPNPKLWQPNGLGEANADRPNLYQVRLALKRGGRVVDRLEFPFGVRTVERLPTAGPRNGDRFENWQFVVNGRKLFVKGMNFTPQDVLLDLPRERYRWTLEAAKVMGVQLIRIWGGGLLETDDFYELCNELGLMVWQDFPIGNQDTPDYPQDVWEAQVVQNITRLRNHPALVVWCGGNEFNAYSLGNAATMGILERNLRTFDPTRLFVRTTPDHGSIHAYPDMDPTWYSRSYGKEAWISETGMHSIPEAGLFYELVDQKEFTGLGNMWDKEFYKTHPEFIHHFTEYGPGRVPRMLSRASHVADVTDPTLETISEASQIGAGEFYQVMSEKVQGNYPVTAGLMPWVFKRHWPVIAIQLMDWFGQATAPYYFLKRTYEPTHAALDLPRLLWKTGEDLPLAVNVTHAGTQPLAGRVAVTAYDDAFRPVFSGEKPLVIPAGPSVASAEVGRYAIPADYRDQFLFLVVELSDAGGKLLSRSTYWPRVLTKMDDPTFYRKYVSEPIAWPTLETGPFLKPTVEKTNTRLKLDVLEHQPVGPDRSRIRVRIQNEGTIPAFLTRLDVGGTKRAFFATDNFFWLAPGETRDLSAEVLWRDTPTRDRGSVTASAWNAPTAQRKLAPVGAATGTRGK